MVSVRIYVTGTQGLGVGHNKTVMSCSEHCWMALELKKLRSVITIRMYVHTYVRCTYIRDVLKQRRTSDLNSNIYIMYLHTYVYIIVAVNQEGNRSETWYSNGW